MPRATIEKRREYDRERYARLKANDPDFYVKKRKKWNSWYRSLDTERRREYAKNQKKWARARAHKYKERLIKLMGDGCNHCGLSDRACLVFHHVDPREKHREISVMLHYDYVGWEKVKKEAEKCLLLCRNCHARVHDEWRRGVKLNGREEVIE